MPSQSNAPNCLILNQTVGRAAQKTDTVNRQKTGDIIKPLFFYAKSYKAIASNSADLEMGFAKCWSHPASRAN